MKRKPSKPKPPRKKLDRPKTVPLDGVPTLSDGIVEAIAADGVLTAQQEAAAAKRIDQAKAEIFKRHLELRKRQYQAAQQKQEEAGEDD